MENNVIILQQEIKRFIKTAAVFGSNFTFSACKGCSFNETKIFSMQGNAQCSKESGKIPSLQMQENMT